MNGTTRINGVGDIIGTSYYVGGTAIVDTSRNLLNIGTIKSGNIMVGGTASDSNFGVYLQNNKWYATQYSSSHDIVRMNANTAGGLDIYNQTDSGFANIRVASVNILSHIHI